MRMSDKGKDNAKTTALKFGYQYDLDTAMPNTSVEKKPDSTFQQFLNIFHKPEETPPPQNIFKTQSDVKFFSSADQIDTELGLEIAAGTTTAIYPCSANLNFSIDAKRSRGATRSYAIITVLQINKEDSVKDVVLSEGAKKCLNSNSIESFYNKFGDRYVKSKIYGNQIFITLEMDEENAEAFRKLQGKLSAEIEGVELKTLFRTINQTLNSVSFINKHVTSVGNNRPWEFNNFQELEHDVRLHSDTDNQTPIGYKVEHYRTIPDLTESEEQKLRELEALSRTRISDMLDKIESKIKDFHDLGILGDNIVELNQPELNQTSAYHNQYMTLKQEAAIQRFMLHTLKKNITSHSTMPTLDEHNANEATFNEICNWFNQNKGIAREITKKALIRELFLLQGQKHTKPFTLEIAPEMARKAKFLLFKFSDPAIQEFQLSWDEGFPPIFKNPFEANYLDARGTYLPIELLGKNLKIELHSPATLPNDTYIEIFAVSDLPEGYNGHVVRLNQKSLNAKKKSDAHNMSNLGLHPYKKRAFTETPATPTVAAPAP